MGIDLGFLVFFVFLVPVQVWWWLHFGFFGFFGACAGLVSLLIQNIGICSVLWTSSQHLHQQFVFRLGFRSPQCTKHRYLQCFVMIWGENSLPHQFPLSLKTIVITCADWYLEVPLTLGALIDFGLRYIDILCIGCTSNLARLKAGSLSQHPQA